MILSILDIKKERKRFIIYIISSIIFSLIYELFSHGVISYYMIFMFIFPFIGLLNIILLKRKKENSHIFFKTSILTFTLFFLIQGILEIYGTTNRLVIIYPIVGLSLLIISIILYLRKD